MISEEEIVLQYEEARDRMTTLRADYDAMFGIANTPEEFETLTLIKTQIDLEERVLRDLQAKLPARESFGAKYSAEILGPHQLSFVIPANVPRIRIIEEAQQLHSKLERRNYVFPARYKVWLGMPSFSEGRPGDIRLSIDGCVDDAQNRTLMDQKFFLKRKFEEGEATLTSVEDLAAAHAIFFVVTRQNLFKGMKIRTISGSLYFDNLGLGMDRFSLDWNRFADVAAACYLPPGVVERLRDEKKKTKNA